MKLLNFEIKDLESLVNLRQTLHQNPELSGNEEYTAEAVKRTVIRFQPDEIIDNIGGYGVACIFKGKAEGPTVMFRADMDALPINEINNLDYASRVRNVAHSCGHDGHMSILVGLAQEISRNRPQKGRVILLFQPAEETGEGAPAVLNDPNFHRIAPDMVFALHNLPEFEKGTILYKPGTFAAASQGLVLKLKGKTSHAAEPHKGISPAIAMAQIIEHLTELAKKEYLFNDFVLTTIVHARLGERSFGTTPGNAEIMVTLRSYNDNDMNTLVTQSHNFISSICQTEQLEYDISFTDVYPATLNDHALTEKVKQCCTGIGLKCELLAEPFPWSEDFAAFGYRYKSTIFGLGAGVDAPKLHNADYNFPDDLIEPGVAAFYSIYKNLFLE